MRKTETVKRERDKQTSSNLKLHRVKQYLFSDRGHQGWQYTRRPKGKEREWMDGMFEGGSFQGDQCFVSLVVRSREVEGQKCLGWKGLVGRGFGLRDLLVWSWLGVRPSWQSFYWGLSCQGLCLCYWKPQYLSFDRRKLDGRVYVYICGRESVYVVQFWSGWQGMGAVTNTIYVYYVFTFRRGQGYR